MADVLTQIQQRQARAQDQELAAAQNDYDWNATFGRMAPDNVLRGTRDMTALIANAVEKKQQLLAQTNAEAQRMYLADQRWKAEQRMQPLKDERLIAQTRADVARQRAAAAKELLDFSRLERAETSIEHTAKAQWEMDQIESATIPEAEKRAWLNTVRGKYPSMDKDTSARHGTLHAVLNPSDEKIRVAGEIARVTGAVKQALAPTQAEREANIKAEATARAEGTAAGKPPEANLSLEKDRKLAAGELSKARSRRERAEASGSEDLKAVADEDVTRWNTALTEAESQIRAARDGTAPAGAPSTAPIAATPAPDFQTADEVRAAFRAGKLPRDQAEAALKNKFGLR